MPRKKLKSYRVCWEINVDARSPVEAAIEARLCQGPETTALCFETYDENGKCVTVDLLDHGDSHD